VLLRDLHFVMSLEGSFGRGAWAGSEGHSKDGLQVGGVDWWVRLVDSETGNDSWVGRGER
jgi:hypothetical protein